MKDNLLKRLNRQSLIEIIRKKEKIIAEALNWVKENQYYFPRPDKLSKILKGEDDNEKID